MKLLPFLLLFSLLIAAAACKKDSESAAPTADGTVTWTHNGTTYTSTVRWSAIVDTGDKIIVTGGSADNNNILPLSLQGINARGAGAYDLRRGSGLDTLPAGALTLNGGSGSGSTYNTL